ncbi:hypothetical protein H4I95_12264 [Botrytis cinerea]
MLPSRKRSKLNPSKEQSTSSSKDTAEPGHTTTHNGQHGAASNKKLGSRASWYGTWPRKSTVSTQVVKETILADKTSNGNMATELSHHDSVNVPRESKPASEITLSVPPRETSNNKTSSKKDENVARDVDNPETPPRTRLLEESDTPKETNSKSSPIAEIAKQPVTSQGWLGWLGMPSQTLKESIESIPVVEEPHKQDTQEIPSNETIIPEQAMAEEAMEAPKQTLSASRSWFNLWSASEPPIPAEGPREPVLTQVLESNPIKSSKMHRKMHLNLHNLHRVDLQRNLGTEPLEDNNKGETGELAVSDEQSQSLPLPVQAIPAVDTKSLNGDKKPKAAGKKSRPKSVDIEEISQKLQVHN